VDKDLIVTIDKDAMKHILESHHPRHFNPNARFTSKGNIKEQNTMFPQNMTEKDVELLLIRILQQEKNEISRLANETSPRRVFQIGGDTSEKDIVIDGIKYTVGFEQEVASNGMRYRIVGNFIQKSINDSVRSDLCVSGANVHLLSRDSHQKFVISCGNTSR